jgi:hypothetical protein
MATKIFQGLKITNIWVIPFVPEVTHYVIRLFAECRKIA